jgi:hypothetical protein
LSCSLPGYSSPRLSVTALEPQRKTLYFGKTRLAIGQNKSAVHVLCAVGSMLIGVQEDNSLVSDSRCCITKWSGQRGAEKVCMRQPKRGRQVCSASLRRGADPSLFNKCRIKTAGRTDYYADIKDRSFAAKYFACGLMPAKQPKGKSSRLPNVDPSLRIAAGDS